jgi:hypothetical protein
VRDDESVPDDPSLDSGLPGNDLPPSLPDREDGPADPFAAPARISVRPQARLAAPAPRRPRHTRPSAHPAPPPPSERAEEARRRADELFAEISRSPLDDRLPRRRALGRWVGLAAALILTGGGAAVAVLLLSGDEAAGPPSTVAIVAENPPGLVLHAAAYDPGTRSVLVFGGEMGEAGRLDRGGALGELTAETWMYRADPGGWARLATSETRPAPRAGHAAAFATDSGLLVVFGGSSTPPVNCQRNYVCSGDLLGDTWALESASGTWQERHPAVAPTPRMGHVVAYDSGAKRVILFGGLAGLSLLDDTWAYDPATDTWEQRAPAVAPPGRAYAVMAYDPESARTLLWAGVSEGDDAAVWAYDYGTDTWASLGDQGAPLARWTAGAAFDPGLEGLVVAGGIALRREEIAEGVTATRVGTMDEAWVFRPGTATWALLPPPSSSGVALQARFAAAYDEAAARLLVYGGVGSETRTLLFDSAETTWIDASPDGPADTTTAP